MYAAPAGHGQFKEIWKVYYFLGWNTIQFKTLNLTVSWPSLITISKVHLISCSDFDEKINSSLSIYLLNIKPAFDNDNLLCINIWTEGEPACICPKVKTIYTFKSLQTKLSNVYMSHSLTLEW